MVCDFFLCICYMLRVIGRKTFIMNSDLWLPPDVSIFTMRIFNEKVTKDWTKLKMFVNYGSMMQMKEILSITVTIKRSEVQCWDLQTSWYMVFLLQFMIDYSDGQKFHYEAQRLITISQKFSIGPYPVSLQSNS